MAFTGEDWSKRPDWNYAQNGAVTLFRKEEILERAIKTLKKIGYVVAELDCSSLDNFHGSVSVALRWNAQFGYSNWNGNLDALDEGMGNLPSDKFLLVARDYQKIKLFDRRLFHAFWDIYEIESRNSLLFGQLALGFVQVDRSDFRLDNLGSRAALWNKAEWLTKDRYR